MSRSQTAAPLRFADAKRINPCQALLDLHAHALGRASKPSREEALAAAVVVWWSCWQPMMIHAAIRRGADLANAAAATGLDKDEVVRRGQPWTDVQTRLIIGGHSGVDPDEVRTVRKRLGREADR